MSTLRVSTIQDTAGSNSSTPAAIANGTAKAWVNFNGTGVVAIRAQYNVSSITDNGTADYTVNFTTAMSDANYVANFSSGQNSAVQYCLTNMITQTASGIRVVNSNLAAGFADNANMYVAIFR
jgi:hypothetical protein